MNGGQRMILEGKRLLITGGTGSLGQALCRRLMTGEMGLPSKITVFSRDETKQHYMRLEHLRLRAATDDAIYNETKDLLSFRIGDIRNYSSVVQAIQETDVVFHAAAMKQVPTCEYFPFEAVQTNIIGTQNLVRAIKENKTSVETVAGISTDKASKPVNVMGMTKAIQERILVQANQECSDTRFICVRYGNVLSSRGSVVPLFIDQIRRGGPVTITLKEMTRFLLSLDDAVDAVFAAVRYGSRGETYIPKVASARVTDIADVLINGRNIPAIYTGIRPGEKVHEILISEEECHRTFERDGYYGILPILPELRMSDPKEHPLEKEYSSREATLNRDMLTSILSPYIPSSSGHEES